MSKGERESKDHVEEDFWERKKQGMVEELECSQGGHKEQNVLVWEHDGLMCLL